MIQIQEQQVESLTANNENLIRQLTVGHGGKSPKELHEVRKEEALLTLLTLTLTVTLGQERRGPPHTAHGSERQADYGSPRGRDRS